MAISLNDVNVLVALTLQSARPPVVTRHQLRDLLKSLADGEATVRAPDDRPALRLRETAAEQGRVLMRHSEEHDDDALMSPRALSDLVRPVANELQRFPLLAAGVCLRNQQDQLDSIIGRALEHTSGELLVFQARAEAPVTIMEPNEGVAAVAAFPERWPGVLLWARGGESAFSDLEHATGLLDRALGLVRDASERVGGLLNEFSKTLPESRSVGLMHISDLHFGRKEALKNQELLVGRIQEHSGSIERLLITGDLFENPEESDAQAFKNFRMGVTRLIGTEPIVVTGNHDRRYLGNKIGRLGQTLEQLVDLDRLRVRADEKSGIMFFGFDSAEEGDFARGRVSEQQLRARATEFELEKRRVPGCERFVRIAMLHHHPYAFETTPTGHLGKLKRAIGIGADSFVRMENSELFLRWCARMSVSLVLHGHQHVPHHVEQKVEDERGNAMGLMTTIGCGTSLGIGKYAMGYDLLTLSPDGSTCGVVFFEEEGGVFIQKMISVSQPGRLLV